MAVDASIYSQFKPFDFGEAIERGYRIRDLRQQEKERAIRLSDLARKQDSDVSKQKYESDLRAVSVTGNVLESLAGMTPQERAAAYPQARMQLIQSGVMDPQDAPESYDEGFYRQNLFRYRQTKEYLDKQLVQSQIAKNKADAASNLSPANKIGKSLTPGQKKADESFAKEASDYYYSGGKAGAEKNIVRLQRSIDKLEENGEISGGLTTKIPWLGQDEQQDWINPEMASVRDDIRAAIQGSLKQILGGQFAQKEADAMFARAFNPRLSDAENIKRATSELESLKNMAADKDRAMAHFMEYGTLQNFTPQKTLLAGGGHSVPNNSNGGLMSEAHASDGETTPQSNVKPGAIVMVDGKHFRVGDDGDTLIPIKTKGKSK